MGLSWQQGPLSPVAIGRFLVPEPLPKRLLYVEPLRRRMRVRFGGIWIADSEDVLLLFEPGRYPMAYFRGTARQLLSGVRRVARGAAQRGNRGDACAGDAARVGRASFDAAGFVAARGSRPAAS